MECLQGGCRDGRGEVERVVVKGVDRMGLFKTGVGFCLVGWGCEMGQGCWWIGWAVLWIRIWLKSLSKLHMVHLWFRLNKKRTKNVNTEKFRGRI